MTAQSVAVIVPNYNKEKTLRTCLESIYAQTHPPTQVIVVDDASTDHSPDIARDFPCTLITHPTNQGPAAARNTGTAASTTPLLFFVDSDTALAPDAIANAVHALHHTPDCGMVQGIYDKHPLFDDGPVEAYRIAFEHFWRRRSVGRETGTLFAASLIPRHVFDQTGGFDETLRNGEDDEFGTRLPARYRLLVTDTVLTRHDDVDQLLPFLWEQFVRASTKPVVMLKAWRTGRAGTVGTRVDLMSPARLRHLDRRPQLSLGVSGLSLLVLGSLWLSLWPLLLLPPLLATFVAVNHDFLTFTHQLRGPRFALFATGMHLLSYAALVAGAAAGLLRVAYHLLRPGHRPVHAAPVSSGGGSQ